MPLAMSSHTVRVAQGHSGDSIAYPWQPQLVRKINGVALDVSSGYTYSCRVTDSAGTTVTASSTSMANAASGIITFTFTDAQVQAMAAGRALCEIDEITSGNEPYVVQFPVVLYAAVP